MSHSNHTHPANLCSESAKELPILKRPPNKKLSSEDVDFLLVAVLYHPLSIAVENRAVSIIGTKLFTVYTGHVHLRILYVILKKRPAREM